MTTDIWADPDAWCECCVHGLTVTEWPSEDSRREWKEDQFKIWFIRRWFVCLRGVHPDAPFDTAAAAWSLRYANLCPWYSLKEGLK